MLLRRLPAALLCAALSAPAAAGIYHYVDDDGTPCFSDQPADPRARPYQPDGAGAPATQGTGAGPADRHLDGAIAEAAAQSRLEPALLHAVVAVESAYNPRAVSPRGALGLMQLMPRTARRYGVRDAFDAAQNLRAGARHLRDLLDFFSQDLPLALAAYNAGTAAVLAHGRRVPPYAETRRYVPAVLRRYEALRQTARR